MKTGGQTKRVLEKCLDKCDHTNEDNLDHEEATSREAIKGVWNPYLSALVWYSPQATA